jgi:hypothetical protein
MSLSSIYLPFLLVIHSSTLTPLTHLDGGLLILGDVGPEPVRLSIGMVGRHAAQLWPRGAGLWGCCGNARFRLSRHVGLQSLEAQVSEIKTMYLSWQGKPAKLRLGRKPCWTEGGKEIMLNRSWEGNPAELGRLGRKSWWTEGWEGNHAESRLRRKPKTKLIRC